MDKESVLSLYISVCHTFMSVSIIEHGAVDNRYMSIIGMLWYVYYPCKYCDRDPEKNIAILILNFVLLPLIVLAIHNSN